MDGGGDLDEHLHTQKSEMTLPSRRSPKALRCKARRPEWAPASFRLRGRRSWIACIQSPLARNAMHAHQPVLTTATWYSPCRPTPPSQEWVPIHNSSSSIPRRRRSPRSARRRMRKIQCIGKARRPICRFHLRHSRYSSRSHHRSSTSSSSNKWECQCSLSRLERRLPVLRAGVIKRRRRSYNQCHYLTTASHASLFRTAS